MHSIYEVIKLKHKHLQKMLTIILTFSLCVYLFCSCSKKEEKSPSKQSENTEKKQPEALNKLEKSVQDIINELDKKEEEETQESETKMESTTETKSEQSAEKEQTETKQETKQEITKESTEDKKWKAVTKKVEEIHKKWNELQPDLVTAGTPKQSIDEFSNTLNSLTVFIESKDMQNTLFSSNELYRILADFHEQFKGKIPPDVKRMSYFIRDAKYNGMSGKWEKAKSSVNNLKSHWEIIRPQTKQEQESITAQTEFSVSELEKVLEQANVNLVKLKSDIALENVKKLEESFEKMEEK